MLPTPTATEKDPPDDILKMYIWSRQLDALGEIEKLALAYVFTILDTKLKAGDNVIDLRAMIEHMSNTRFPLTEGMCRRLIGKYEWEKLNDDEFILTNGDEKWKTLDTIRAAKIQKRAKREAKRRARGQDWVD